MIGGLCMRKRVVRCRRRYRNCAGCHLCLWCLAVKTLPPTATQTTPTKPPSGAVSVPLQSLRLYRAGADDAGSSQDPAAQTPPPPTWQAPPPPPSLVDGQRRKVSYLRLSVTDRCNFRCVYCMPAEGAEFAPRPELLTFEEMEEIVESFVALGITHVRLTGGEPLLRRDIVDLVGRIARIDGVEDLAMTTNGAALVRLAKPLKDAGLKRLNISIDTLREKRFKTVTRTGDLARVLAGITAAEDAGFERTKLNAVVVRGFNDDELSDLVRFAIAKRVTLRFIEYMPIGTDNFWSADTFLSTETMLERLASDFEIELPIGQASSAGIVGGGPAVYRDLVAKDGSGRVRVGFISALSHNFCASCNRVRLTSTGTLQECLAYMGSLSLRDALRSGADRKQLTALIESALWMKGPGHRYDGSDGPVRTQMPMSAIGG